MAVMARDNGPVPRDDEWCCSYCGQPAGESYQDLPESCPECGWTWFRQPRNAGGGA